MSVHNWDKEASLYYAKARYYDPFTARFTQADSFLGTIDDPPSLHRYQYAAANPTYFTDPTGHFLDSRNLQALAQAGEQQLPTLAPTLVATAAGAKAAITAGVVAGSAAAAAVVGAIGALWYAKVQEAEAEMLLAAQIASYRADRAAKASVVVEKGYSMSDDDGLLVAVSDPDARETLLRANGIDPNFKPRGGAELVRLGGPSGPLDGSGRSQAPAIGNDGRPSQPSRRGVIYVREKTGRSQRAQEWEDAAPGRRVSSDDGREVPALLYSNPNRNGSDYVRFDGRDERDPRILIDRKLGVTTKSDQVAKFGNVLEALAQNPDIRLRIEVPSRKAATDFRRLLRYATGQDSHAQITILDLSQK